ncbi:MAG: exodeoxyribonuclease VII large subunit [Deltaproteobacteria bacterium]|nr:MAG: exodeoxyribonuclease VII large subunit [Deltaproteobacteria bacterium]
MFKNIFSVNESIKAVNKDLDTKYSNMKILGEISMFKPWRSGHAYFDLKDNESILPAVLLKKNYDSINFKIADGLKVIACGNIVIYTPKSKLQLLVSSIEPLGIGSLSLQFQRLKEKLSSEGLFDMAFKKKLPYCPNCIGIVTSPQSAALQDLLLILHQRMPCLNILIAPSKVQGENSEVEISNAIWRLDNTKTCDIIILARGGGSHEDLESFNKESIARTIFNCKTPIISSIGHENDYCIADLVADVRCATPSHAAQIATPIKSEIITKINIIKINLRKILESQIRSKELHLSNLLTHLVSPQEALNKKIYSLKKNLIQLNNKLTFAFQNTKSRLSILREKLNMLSPLQVLSRGYAILHKSNKIVFSIADINTNDILKVRILDGFLEIKVNKKWNLN